MGNLHFLNMHFFVFGGRMLTWSAFGSISLMAPGNVYSSPTGGGGSHSLYNLGAD